VLNELLPHWYSHYPCLPNTEITTTTFIFLSRLLFSLHHARHFDVSFCSRASSTSRDARNRSILVRSYHTYAHKLGTSQAKQALC